MTRWRVWCAGLAVLLWSAGLRTAEAAQKLRVVTTMSSYADLAKAVGGEWVDVSSVASPRFNPHFIEPKPNDVVRVKNADLLIHSGLDLELWRWPLVDAAGNREVMPGGPRELDLSRGIHLLEVPGRLVSRSEGDQHLYGNPHYWTSPENGKIIATEIADKLAEIDPAHAADYQRNLRAFVTTLETKMAEWRTHLAPLKGREILAYHNEWAYLTDFAGLELKYYLEPKPGIPPTPRHIQFLEQYIRDKGIHVIVQPTYQPKEAAEQLSARTGVKVVLLCQNDRELPACSNYISTVDYNIQQLVGALGGTS